MDGLDVIIVDDDPAVGHLLGEIVSAFYTWGRVRVFNNPDEALLYCLSSPYGAAVFVVDVFLGGKNGFSFLDSLEAKFPRIHQDAVMITGHASEDVVNMCMASEVCCLLEKPVRPFALQFAVRSITEKYLRFAKRLLEDREFAARIARLESCGN